MLLLTFVDHDTKNTSPLSKKSVDDLSITKMASALAGTIFLCELSLLEPLRTQRVGQEFLKVSDRCRSQKEEKVGQGHPRDIKLLEYYV